MQIRQSEEMKSKLIACRVMIDEIRPFLAAETEIEVFEISRHIHPSKLKDALQEAIARADGCYDPILLGYGLCSNSVVGLKAKCSRIVIPKMHDCIGIFLGSHQAYLDEHEKEPGTYFLTQGYIQGYLSEAQGPMGDWERAAKKYGPEKADELMGIMMKNYRRLVYIRTPESIDLEGDRQYAHRFAERFSMRYEEMESSSRLLHKLVSGDWDEEFVVMEPGKEVTQEQFLI
ncbi:MAG: hypothetical protein H6Q04_1768 [Acidobacteria bacterium]|nr:hypothetical protein [Acidobacteriota bacterium]